MSPCQTSPNQTSVVQAALRGAVHPQMAEGQRPFQPAAGSAPPRISQHLWQHAALFPSASLTCLQPPSKSSSHTGHSIRACCTSRKSLEKEHPIPFPSMGSRGGSTEAWLQPGMCGQDSAAGLGLQRAWNRDGRCHSSCSSFFWSLLATVCWMISSPSASSSFMRSRMALRTLFLFLQLQSVS